jgi:hypothetical protein
MVTTYTTCFNIRTPCILLTECMYKFCIIIAKTTIISLKNINHLVSVMSDFSLRQILNLYTLGLILTPTEMSTWNLPGKKGRPTRKTDTLTSGCELIF